MYLIHHHRGGVKIEKRENLGQCPNRGGRGKKKQKCPNLNLGILKTEGGGHYFSKMSQSQSFDSVVCNITFIRNVGNSKMSQFGQRGGGQHFSKMSQIQKCPKFKNVPNVRGGGVNPNWDIVPNFLAFLF